MTISAPPIVFSAASRVSSVSAGGQLEQPSEVKSSTRTGTGAPADVAAPPVPPASITRGPHAANPMATAATPHAIDPRAMIRSSPWSLYERTPAAVTT